MPRQNNIQFRKGSYAQWDATSTTVLASGEPGFVTDLNILKIGDGNKQWSDLPGINDNLITVVRNDTGSTINKMSVVYISGALGDIPRVALALANGEPSSSKTYGLVVNNIATGGTGVVVVDGPLRNLDTNTQFSALSEGTALWLSPTVSGGITSNKPYAPNHSVFVGTLIRKHSQQGVINVKIQNGYELEELHNVATTGAINGQFLQYNSGSGLWVPSSSGNFTTLSINGASVATDNSSIVRTTGNQTISGIKTFSTVNSDSVSATINLSGPAGFQVTDESFFFIDASNNFNVDTETGVANFFDAMYVDTSNVGIGTSSPGAKLDVNGTLSAISGNFTQNLQFNGTGVSISGHSHTVSDITNFGSAVSGLLPTIANSGDNRVLTSTGSSFGINAESNLTFDGTNLSAPYLLATYASGDEGGEVQLTKPPNSTLSGGITIDAYQNRLRFFEQGGSARGFYLDISSGGAGVSTNLAGGGGSATTVSNYADNRIITSDGTSTGLNAESNFTFNGSLLTITGSGSITSGLFLTDQTASTIASFDGNKKVASLSTTTYPSLTELSYVKGVTTAIQTQLNNKQSILSNPVTGVGISGYLSKWISSSIISSGIIYDDGNNVGIGTSTPTAKLAVSGTVLASSGLYVNAKPLSDLPMLYVRTTDGSADKSSFVIQNSSYSNLFDIRNDGNCQIGGIAGLGLTHRFNIKGSTAPTVAALNIIDSGNNNLLFVRNDGNIGIGTTTPTSKLHVIGDGIISGNMTIGGNLIVNGTTVTANVDTVTVEDPVITLGLSSGNIVPNLTYDIGLALVRGTGLTAFMGWDTSDSEFVLLSSGVAGANSGTYTPGTYGDLRANSFIKHNGTSSQFLKADGSADSTSYQPLLSNPVTGTGVANHIPYWSTTSGIVADSGQLYWDSTNDRLGIGTSSPSAKLHTSISDGSLVLLLARSGTLAGLSLDFTSNFSNIRSYYGFKVFTGSTTANGGTERMHITDTGYIGIGTSSPSEKIHVSGTQTTIRLNNSIGYDTQLRLTDSVSDWSVGINQGNSVGSGFFNVRSVTAGANRLTIDTNGNIGVGTASPTSKFHVVGSGLFSSDVRSSGSFIGGSGTALLPSFEFINDPDTGLFSPASDTLSISTSGVERLRINNNGQVGINTTNFNFYDIENNIPTPAVSISGSLLIQTAIDFYNPNETSQYQRGRITSLGDAVFNTLGVGEKNDTFGNAVVMNTNGLVVNNAGGVGGSACQLLPDYGIILENTLIINSNNNGNATVGIGTSTPSGALDVSGDVNIDGNLTFDSYTESVVANGNSGTSKTLSLASGTVHTCTLTGNCTFTMPTATAGKSFSLFLNSGSGNYTASFSGVRWADSATPTATITASKVDIYSFISDGTYWYGSFSQNYG